MVQEHIPNDKFVWSKVKPYCIYVSMFVTTIYCNFRALEVSNVETLIVARSCVPIIVTLLEFLFMGRALPNIRSWCAMVVMAGSAAGYVSVDAAFEAEGIMAYFWVLLYCAVISVEMAYAKHIVGPQLGFKSMWGPVLYTNTISIVPMALIGILSGEQNEVCSADWSASTFSLVAISCVMGIAMSYLGFKARSMVSATCFTILGVANKMLTVTANVLIWDKHATPLGIFFLAVCLVGAAAFQQPPLRKETAQLLDQQGQEEPLKIASTQELKSSQLLDQQEQEEPPKSVSRQNQELPAAASDVEQAK